MGTFSRSLRKTRPQVTVQESLKPTANTLMLLGSADTRANRLKSWRIDLERALQWVKEGRGLLIHGAMSSLQLRPPDDPETFYISFLESSPNPEPYMSPGSWSRLCDTLPTTLFDVSSMLGWRALKRFGLHVYHHPRQSLLSVFWPLATAITINDNIVEITNINGRSMAPTLSPDFHEIRRRDWMMWNKWQPTKDLKRGDIIMYDNPKDPEACAVKRVIALPGDTVILDRRRRPGRDDEDKVNRNEIVARKNWDALEGSVTVPFGHLWVEGDNWRKSFDSNHVGPISKSLVIAKAVYVVWPWERMGTRPWERLYAGRTKVIKGKEEAPGQWQDLVGTP